MRFTIGQPSFSRIIAEAARVANNKRSPILSCVLIRADESGRVFITGSDLNTSITTTATANVEEAGGALVPASELSGLVSRLGNDGALMVEGVNEFEEAQDSEKWIRSSLTIRWGKKNHASINGLNPLDFPTIPTLDDVSPISMKALAFSDVMGRVANCAATDESRPMLTGVSFRRQGDNLVLSSTDGFCAAIENIPDAPDFPDVIIPAVLLMEAAKLARARVKNQEDDTIRLGITANGSQIVLQCGSFEISGPLLEGSNFPQVKQIMRPVNLDKGSIILDSQNLRQALGRATALMSEVLTLNISRSENGIRLTSESVIGGGSEEIAGEVFGDIPSIGVNPRILDKMLSGAPLGNVELAFESAPKPISLRHPAAPNWACMIMPMHLNKPEDKKAKTDE